MKFININARSVTAVQLKELADMVGDVTVVKLPDDLALSWANMPNIRSSDEVCETNNRIVRHVMKSVSKCHEEVAVILNGDLSACLDIVTKLVKNNIKILVPVTSEIRIRSEWKPEYGSLGDDNSNADVIIRKHIMFRKMLF